jgi:hypothetical protein
MSLSNSIHIPLILPNIDIFTFGESSLFGYDSSNHCFIVHSFIEVNNLTDQSIDRLHLSSSPIYPIQHLILNPDETILALFIYLNQIILLQRFLQNKIYFIFLYFPYSRFSSVSIKCYTSIRIKCNRTK